MRTPLFDGEVAWQPIVLAILATLLIAWFAARVASRLAAAALRAMLSDELIESSPLVRAPLRLVKVAVFVLIAMLLLFPAFQLAGLQPRTGVDLGALAAWAFGSGLKVILIAVLAYALIRATDLLVRRFEYEMARGTDLDALERAKRARTLGAVVSKGATIVIAGIAALMILQEFHLDITPVLTGAGIAGLAVGFGAQALVRDVISGFFLIMENQVRVGDVAAINGTGGLVEQINLRTIVLRDLEGTVHVFPNGAITTLSNRSKDFSHFVMDLALAYDEDPDRVAAVVREVGSDMQSDPHFGPYILDPVEVLGVNDFADWSIKLRFRVRTLPLKQWEVGREFRRRLKAAFDRHGIEFPFPHQTVTIRERSSVT